MEKDTRHDDVYLAALAGLLHDVGKFAQRGAERGTLEGKDAKRLYGRYHALLTADFLQDVLPFGDEVRLPAANHHVPQTRADWLVKAADVLSAGERAKVPQGKDTRAVQPRQLLSIFSVLEVNNVCWKDQQEHWRFFPLQSLVLKEKVVFPDAALPDEKVWTIYEARWEAFKKDAELLKSATDLAAYLEAMLALLQRYTWCMPSAYYHSRPDVSLYDHSRMTAALAAVMANEDEFPEERLKQLAEGDPEVADKDMALLVGGDISGVQDFIYTISSKGAAKMLRGRSFYLQLLTEAVLRFVLREMGLPYTNVIYSGGGHFYLLAPLKAQEDLPRIQAEVAKILLKQHGTQLYLVLGSASVPAKGFQIGQLRAYWQAMHNDLTRAKHRRYVELRDDLYARVFTVPEYGGNPENTCAVCSDDKRDVDNWGEGEAQAQICPLCRSFAEELGKNLPHARFLALKFSEPQISDTIAETAPDILRTFGMEIQFLESDRDKVEVNDDEQLVIWALDDPPSERWPHTPKLAARWLRYTANRVPMVRSRDEVEKINQCVGQVKDEEKAMLGQPMTFSHLQVLAESGFERLGVLRMDVDNLGTIFKEGLGKSLSLSRMATLSFQVSLFFEGWLKRIVEAEAWENLVYTVYAGGDDLFLLAPWDRVPALAQKIVQDFTTYTGQHPGLHISGGMAFVGGKYPIYQAAEDAADAESLAKEGDKNAFGFLNKRWEWPTFRELAARKDELKELVVGTGANEKGGPTSILQTLRLLANMEEQAAEKKGHPVWGRWMWQGAYQLKRMEKRYENIPELKEKIARVREKLGSFQCLETWGAAARWAQLETRHRKQDE